MSDKPLVSVLMPAYNAQAWITDAIQSVLEQTWPRIELIIVNDGSIDRTLSIAQRFASKNILVVDQENHGAAAARNRAYSLSQGNYIQWLDPDDLLAPDKIARQMHVLERYPGRRALVSSAVGYFFYRTSKAKFSPSALWCDLAPVEWQLRKMEHGAHLQAGTWLIARELAEAGGLWDIRLSSGDDGDYSARLVLASEAIQFVPEARLFYRKSNPTSLSTFRLNKQLDSVFLSIRLQIDHLRRVRDDERARAACVNYMQIRLNAFYPGRPDIVEQLERLASSLGGHLKTPRLRWKYAWLHRILGYRLAKRAQVSLPNIKWTLVKNWDKILSRLECRKSKSRAGNCNAKSAV
jgi:glycosyltransferase involved in cell wall biosynthesis